MAQDAIHEGEVIAERALDPFGLVPDWASKIAGLGGTEHAQDANYALHTIYIPVAEGHANFRVRFHGLTGKLGTMILRVHMYQKGSKDARLTVSERILLSRLVQLGGAYNIRFEAFHGVVYALYASIEGMTDAKARGVEILLDRPGDDNAPLLPATEARNSEFGRDAVKAAPSIISIARATLADPVSQRCTGAQLGEPAFRHWSRRLGAGAAAPLDRWCEIYVLQVLTRYGMLLPGANGLGLGAGSSRVAAVAVVEGASIQVVDGEQDEQSALARLRHALPDSDQADTPLRYRAADLGILPRDLVNFDFLWSERVASRLGSAADGVRFCDRAMAHLRPGGLAVHVVDFALSPESVEEDPGIVAWQRGELDRLALILISRGHEVAEIKVDEHRAPTRDDSRRRYRTGITAAGLIARKARTIE